MNNPYWENINVLAEKQRAKGISTYGCGIEMNRADLIARIQHLQEELVDALMYCEWIKDKFGEEKWIPVSERLPKTEDAVLCFIKNGKQDILQFDHFENLWIGQQWTYKRHAVTHWMPLPEPPKEEDNGKE